jgi:hypothetical protein
MQLEKMRRYKNNQAKKLRGKEGWRRSVMKVIMGRGAGGEINKHLGMKHEKRKI